MRKVFFVVALTTLQLVPSHVDCQAATSVSAGPTYVFGAASEWAGPGFNIQAGKEFGHFRSALFRVDALFMQRSGNGVTRSPIAEQTYALAGSLVLRRAVGGMASYALAGVGLYGDNSWASYTPGLNAGIGFDIPVGRTKLFAESRIHQYWRDARESPRAGRGVTLVPISFGFRF